MENQTTNKPESNDRIELVYLIKELLPGIERYTNKIDRGDIPLKFKGITPLVFTIPESTLLSIGADRVQLLGRIYKKEEETVEILYTDDERLSRYNGAPVRRLTYAFERELPEAERSKRSGLESKFYTQLKENSDEKKNK